jgi:hypothetical protein
MLTHEIGHCLLKLRGFHGLVCDLEDEQILAGLLNDVGTHVELYALQRSIGHEPQSEIDSRIDYNIKSCSKAKPGTIHETQTTLLLADDILNCSKAKGELLKSTLRKNLPKVLGLVETIVSESSKYDLHNPEQNVSFRQSLVSRLSLRGNWKALDYLQEIKGL